jgi:Flp pilus assembly protein TadD
MKDSAVTPPFNIWHLAFGIRHSAFGIWHLAFGIGYNADPVTNRPKSMLVLAALLVVATFVTYVPSLGNGFIWDDDYYVTHNEHLRTLGGLGAIWFDLGAVPQYYPLTHTTFWIEYQLWGLWPAGYHLTNLLLHIAAALLWWRVLRRIGLSDAAAWFAAAIFALHPIEVESVAWITERKNVLSTVLYLGAALAYMRFDERRGEKAAYALAILLFVGALLSKTVTATLPPALLLVAYLRRGRIGRRDLLTTAPLFVVGIAMGLVTVIMERHTVGAEGAEWAYSAVDRVLIAGRALCFYAGKLLWPTDLIFIYPRWDIDATAAWQYVFPAAALAAILALWLARKRLGRGPLVGVLYFAGTLFPALGFFNVFPMRYSFVADHFQYLAGMGLIAIVAAALARRRAGVVVLCVALCMLAPLTWRQTAAYKDPPTLWRTTLARNDQAWMAHNNYGILLADEGKHAQAIEHFKRATELKPDHAHAFRHWGQSLLALGDVQDALMKMRTAVTLAPNDARIASTYGQALLKAGRLDEAEAALRRAAALAPRQAAVMGPTLVGLGLVAIERKDYAGAVEPLLAALRFTPDDAAAHRALALTYDAMDQPADAAHHFERALALDPNSAATHNNYAMLLGRYGRLDEAETHLRQAIRIDPSYAAAHSNLGVVRLASGDAAGAVASFERALEIDPDRPVTLRSCAWILATYPDDAVRNGPRAVELAQRAVNLRGDDPTSLDTLAAALAQAGNFDQAIATARRAAELAGDGELADQIKVRIALYQQGKPYHSSR